MSEHARHELLEIIRTVVGVRSHIYMKTVSAGFLKRLRGEISPESVLLGNGGNYGFESDRIVRRFESVAVFEINLVLAGALFVMRALGENSHFAQSEADFPAHIHASVLGSYIHITRSVVRNAG